MRPVKRTLGLLFALVPACCLPPRADDRSEPERAFETFRGAIARKEFDRAYGLLSDGLRKKIGVRSRADFMDWGAVAGRRAVSAIRRAKPKGPVEPLPDGRARLRVRVSWFVFGRDVELLFTRVAVVRAYVRGSESPVFYDHLEGLEVVREGEVAGVPLAAEAWERMKEGVQGGRLCAFEVREEWFLDDYDMGDGNE
jgi:hypothetical protein